MNISAFGTTHIGGSKNKENQDTFFVGDGLYGVLDGHGVHGMACALAARDCLSRTGTTFAEADAAVCAALVRAGAGGGGTTASILRLDRETGAAEVSHVGDSDVRWYDSEGEGNALTADHSPTSRDEYQRYQAAGSTALFRYAKLHNWDTPRTIFVPDVSTGEPSQNPAGYYYNTVRNEWAANVEDRDTRGMLAMTRALGDIDFKRIGVHAEPSVLTASPLASGTRAYVMASDGVWDIMQFAAVGAIVRRPDLIGNAEAAAAAILDAALAQQRALLGTSGDNATVVVVYVSHS
jgi:serine/threonine protein phosphatase PrpC